MHLNKQNIKIHFVIICIYFVIFCLYSFLNDKNNLLIIKSYFAGVFIYIIPHAVSWYYLNRRKIKDITLNNTIYDAIYATIIKYMLLILLFGICFKFFIFDNKVIVFTFISIECTKILLYFIFPSKYI